MESLILHNNLSHEPLTVASSDGCLTPPRKLGNAQEKAFEGGVGALEPLGFPYLKGPLLALSGPPWVKEMGVQKRSLLYSRLLSLSPLFLVFRKESDCNGRTA